MEELWSRVMPSVDASDDFDDVVDRHFAHVEHRDTESYVLWETREDCRRTSTRSSS
jgi:hypothetical protein